MEPIDLISAIILLGLGVIALVKLVIKQGRKAKNIKHHF